MCSALLVKATCDMDLNDVDSKTPRGMMIKHLCPKSCGQCSVTEPAQAQSTNQTGFDYGLCSVGMVNTQQLSMGVVGNSQHFMTMLKSNFECVDSPGFLHWLASEWPGSGMPTSCADVSKFGALWSIALRVVGLVHILVVHRIVRYEFIIRGWLFQAPVLHQLQWSRNFAQRKFQQ